MSESSHLRQGEGDKLKRGDEGHNMLKEARAHGAGSEKEFREDRTHIQVQVVKFSFRCSQLQFMLETKAFLDEGFRENTLQSFRVKAFRKAIVLLGKKISCTRNKGCSGKCQAVPTANQIDESSNTINREKRV